MSAMTSKYKGAAAAGSGAASNGAATLSLSPGQSPHSTAPTAMYRRIEQDMRARVLAGRWAAGMMIPSRKSLAEEYGVDLRTVQRAIATLLSDGTLTAHGGRGTFVAQRGAPQDEPDPAGPIFPSAPLAWSRNGQSKLVIGVVVNQLVNPAEVAPRAISSAIHTAARQTSSDLRILTLDSYADSLDAMVRQETEAFNIIEHEGLAGAIVWHSGGERTLPQLQRIIEKNIPLVLIDRYTKGLSCDFVGIDNVFSAVEAVEYLLSLGHTRIGFLAPQEDVSAIHERLAGYRKALSKAGIALRSDLEFRPELADSLELASLQAQMAKTVRAILAMPEPPTAIFAVNDVQAHHLINALEELGLPVPAKMSVIGFDDIDRYSPRAPFLTTMRQSFESIGERAADLLLQRIESRQRQGRKSETQWRTNFNHIFLPTKLVVRQSCAPRVQSPGDP